MDQDLVFKALADANRRRLLDLLFQRDGQTLTELQGHLPMTRFGTMKHLQILEHAGLISTRKVGREKHHYLNPVPIQLVYDRWVSKYARSWTRALTGLKYELEDKPVTDTQRHVFEVFIRTSPEQLWQALTDGTFTEQYYFGSHVESSWEAGAPYSFPKPGGGTLLDGQVLEIEPPRRLVTSFRPLWMGEQEAARVSKVTWEIESLQGACKLTLIHDELDPASPLTAQIFTGWARILSGLKTLLETGEPLVIAE
jgi:uncharacterized protein YndB with AHSA1/START domain/DNA-binding transcriptional ArsR family regulator